MSFSPHRTFKLSVLFLLPVVSLLPACGGGQSGIGKGAADLGAAKDAGKAVAEPSQLASRAENTTPEKSSVVSRFIPPNATSIFWQRLRAIEEFGVPYFVSPEGRADGLLPPEFKPREVEEIALISLGGGDRPQVSYLQLAPGATVQRIINGPDLQKDETAYPGFTTYGPRQKDQGYGHFMVVKGDRTCIVGPEDSLKPVLTRSARRQGPLEKQFQALQADNDMVVCAMAEYSGLNFAGGYLELSRWLLPPDLENGASKLPAGTFTSLGLALRLNDKPQAQLILVAADESLAGEVDALAESCLQHLRKILASGREGLRKRLPADAAGEIDQFLADLVEGIVIKKEGTQIGITFPLGKDAATLRRFAELANRDDVRLAHHLDAIFNQVREQEKLKDPRQRLAQLALAMHTYRDVNGYLPRDTRDPAGRPLLSWRVELLPMLEQEPLYNEFHRDEPWYSEHNKTLLAKMPDVLRGDAPAGSTLCRLQVFAGPATLFNDQKQRLRGNGFKTIFAVETPAELAVPWTKPADLTYVPDDPASVLGKIPAAGVRVLFFDGTTKLLPATLTAEEWRDLIGAKNPRKDSTEPD